MNRASEFRTYERSNAICFRMTSGAFGGLSNMAPGFPLRVNGLHIYTSEALYQACRFPHLPEIQKMIVEQRSPMTAKMRSKPYRRDSRTDWDRVRVKVMRWCLRIKLVQHSCKFKDLLLSTDSRSIVEESQKDDFWGAKPTEDGTLIGTNVLGRLLMELREEVKKGKEIVCVSPLTIPDFLLLRDPILEVYADADIETTDNSAVSKDFRDPRIPSQLPLIPDQSMPPATTPIDRSLNHALQPYSEYKDSGLPWLDCFPRDWRVLRGKSVFSTVDVRSQTGKEELLTVSTSNGVRPRSQQTVTMFMAKSYVGHKLCWPGDLVVNSLWAWMQGLGVAQHHGLISSAYSVYRPRREFTHYSRFFHYLLRSAAYKWELLTRSKGVWTSRLQLLDQAFMDMPIVLPSSDEQDAIVRFLDYANGRIDQAIHAKKKLIALMNEQKQAIIHRAVTRGLNPQAAFKASGIPWLGDIPKHWQILRAKYLFREVDERSSGGNEELLSVSHITGVTPRSEKNITMFKARSYVGYKLCCPGDLVVNTMWAWMAALGVSAYTGIVSSAYAVYRPRDPEKLIGGYIEGPLHTQPYVSNITCRSTGLRASRLRLYPEEFFRLPIIVPPAPEQREIVSRIASETATQNRALKEAEREIGLLLEYRTRLTADIVMGKLDVREAARKLPASMDEIPAAADEEEFEEEADA